jgi:hypothetical protein
VSGRIGVGVGDGDGVVATMTARVSRSRGSFDGKITL